MLQRKLSSRHTPLLTWMSQLKPYRRSCISLHFISTFQIATLPLLVTTLTIHLIKRCWRLLPALERAMQIFWDKILLLLPFPYLHSPPKLPQYPCSLELRIFPISLLIPPYHFHSHKDHPPWPPRRTVQTGHRSHLMSPVGQTKNSCPLWTLEWIGRFLTPFSPEN